MSVEGPENQSNGAERSKFENNGIIRGRRAGSTKAQAEKAEKLRSRGRSNEEIAKALGVSTRTVTRYLKKTVHRPLSPIMEAVTRLPKASLMKLFKIRKSGDSDEIQQVLWLFILRRLRHPEWKKLWGEASEGHRGAAENMNAGFSWFIRSCRRDLYSEPDGYFDDDDGVVDGSLIE